MSLENLPGTFPLFQDGNLQLSAVNNNPVVLVLGTAAQGISETTYSVASVSQAAAAFGKADGTLVRTLFEVVAGGAQNIRLFRIGATPATLAKIGDASSTLQIVTGTKDDSAGTDYSLFWNQSAGRLMVFRVIDGAIVYDNNPAYPSAAVDLQEVSVSGTPGNTGTNVGSLSVPLTLKAANGGPTKNVYTAGLDGITLSRMELFEALYKAYQLLENENVDLVLPANVYLDDLNVQDMTSAEVSALNGTSSPWFASSAYPLAGSIYDALGTVFAQEYQGEWYFWWDMDRDGVAEIYPTVGSATASQDAYGVALSRSDFHEANFGYQLADFCYRKSENDRVVHSVIGMNPPQSWSLKDVSNWIGRSPVTTTAQDGTVTITVSGNGSGLLGNKWKAGRRSTAGGLPGFTIDGIEGLAGGGFIGTDSGWPDGLQQKDNNNHRIDIGKYMSVVGAQAILSNSTSLFSYAASGSAVYVGFISSLPSNSAPTNKIQPGARLPFRISVGKLDALAGAGYVMFQQKPQGVVVSDAPTAARTDSDYRRLTTFRIVNASVEAVRSASQGFLGEGITGSKLAALESQIGEALHKLQKGGYLQRYDAVVTSTPAQQIQGKATVELVLVPAFELRQITVIVSLSAQ